MRCTPVRPHEARARETHAREIHAHEVHAHETHAHQILLSRTYAFAAFGGRWPDVAFLISALNRQLGTLSLWPTALRSRPLGRHTTEAKAFYFRGRFRGIQILFVTFGSPTA